MNLPEDFPIDVINVDRDISSGMHTPEGETMWSMPSVAMADDLDEDEDEDEDLSNKISSRRAGLQKIFKSALGLLDLPTSMGEGDRAEESAEVLNFEGTHQNPGLSRETGDGESVNFFGEEDETFDMPQINEKYSNRHKGIRDMKKDLRKIEKFLREAGRGREADDLGGLIKISIFTDEQLGNRYREDLDSAPVRTTQSKGVISVEPGDPEEPDDTSGHARPGRIVGRIGSIRIPGDPYTYNKHPDGYVVSSADTSKGASEKAVGAVIKRDHSAYKKILSYDKSVTSTSHLDGDFNRGQVDRKPGVKPATADEIVHTETLPDEHEGTPHDELLEPEVPSQIVGSQRIFINRNQQLAFMKYFISTMGDERGRESQQKFIAGLAAGSSSVKVVGEIEAGRKVGVVDFGEIFPVDLRFDGVIFNSDKNYWAAGSLTPKEVRSIRPLLDSEKRRGAVRELRRERSSNRRTDKLQSREDRKVDRLRRRDRARKAARKAELDSIFKIAKN